MSNGDGAVHKAELADGDVRSRGKAQHHKPQHQQQHHHQQHHPRPHDDEHSAEAGYKKKPRHHQQQKEHDDHKEDAVELVAVAGPGSGTGQPAAAADEPPRLRTSAEIMGLVDKPFSCKEYVISVFNAANITTWITLAMAVVGYLLNTYGYQSTGVKYLLAMGLFGFSGGFTNWLAVKMLFDKVPLLYGSGVIPDQYVSIRVSMKTTIMSVFFDEQYMEHYMGQRLNDFARGLDLKSKVNTMMTDPRLDDVIVQNLESAGRSGSSSGAIIAPVASMMGGYRKMVPFVKPLLNGFALQLAEDAQSGELVDINQSTVDVKAVRAEIEAFMDDKIQVVTPELVKKMMEDVIRDHLGMLVVWGNIMGVIMGVAAVPAGLS